MTITITADDPRSIRAIEVAAGAAQWLKVRGRDGQKAYGVPSACQPGRYYLVTNAECDCPDFQRNGLSTARLGHAGEHRPCKHVLAVRLHCELVKAQQKPARPASSRRGRLSIVPPTVRYEDVFARFAED